MNSIMKVIKNNKILTFSILAYCFLFVYNQSLGIKAINGSIYYFIEMLQVLPAVFILTSLIQAWVPTKVIINNFGNGSGMRGSIISFAIGSLSAGPIYAAFPVCRTLLDKGASVKNIVIILSSWAVIKLPMLLNEMQFMGTAYMAVRWVLTILAVLGMSYIMNKLIKKEDVAGREGEDTSYGLRVNKSACIGCGACVRLYPKIFSLKDKKAVIHAEVEAGILEEIREKTQQVCPVKAIY